MHEIDAEDDDPADPTTLMCTECDRTILFLDEVMLLELVVPVPNPDDGTITFQPLVDENGEYTHSPAFFDLDCWDGVEHSLKHDIRHAEIVHHVKGIVVCDICSSDILPWETMARARWGEIHASNRSPNGEDSQVFSTCNCDTEVHICVACTARLPQHVDGGQHHMWGQLIPPFMDGYACQGGIRSRCWRQPTCLCREAAAQRKEARA